MAEHHRIQDEAGTTQWVDCDRCVLVDPKDGKPVYFSKIGRTIVAFQQALDYIKENPWCHKHVIVKFDAVAPFNAEAEIRLARYERYVAMYGSPTSIMTGTLVSMRGIWPADAVDEDGTIQIDGRPIGKAQFQALASCISPHRISKGL